MYADANLDVNQADLFLEYGHCIERFRTCMNVHDFSMELYGYGAPLVDLWATGAPLTARVALLTVVQGQQHSRQSNRKLV